MTEGLLFVFRYFTLLAALGMLACLLSMFLAMLVWMMSLKVTLRVHAPLVDEVPAWGGPCRAPAEPLPVAMAAHRA